MVTIIHLSRPLIKVFFQKINYGNFKINFFNQFKFKTIFKTLYLSHLKIDIRTINNHLRLTYK